MYIDEEITEKDFLRVRQKNNLDILIYKEDLQIWLSKPHNEIIFLMSRVLNVFQSV